MALMFLQYVVIFEARRAKEILEIAEPFAGDIIHCAYFSSENPDTAEKLCHLVHELEKREPEVIE